jgi:ketosteroid isomerase-like protein
VKVTEVSAPVDEPRRVVESFIAARNAQDHEQARALLSPDLEWVVSPSSGNPLHGEQARNALVGGLSNKLVQPNSERRTIERITVDGSAVLVEYTIEAVTVAGRNYHASYSWMYDVLDGLIVRITTYSDSLAGWRAFGEETVKEGLAAVRKTTESAP